VQQLYSIHCMHIESHLLIIMYIVKSNVSGVLMSAITTTAGIIGVAEALKLFLCDEH